MSLEVHFHTSRSILNPLWSNSYLQHSTKRVFVRVIGNLHVSKSKVRFVFIFLNFSSAMERANRFLMWYSLFPWILGSVPTSLACLSQPTFLVQISNCWRARELILQNTFSMYHFLPRQSDPVCSLSLKIIFMLMTPN